MTAALPKDWGSSILSQRDVGSNRVSVNSHLCLSLWPLGMLYYAAIHEKLFTTKLGNSFKCASKQTFSLEKNFQLLLVNVQLQAFDFVDNQFGKGR